MDKPTCRPADRSAAGNPSLQCGGSARFARFVAALTRVADRSAGDESAMVAAGRPLLEDLLAADDWLDDEHAVPHPQHYRQYRLHVDPLLRFSVVSFVWGPGQRTPVHDHTVWGLVGVLRGGEIAERFEAGSDGRLRPTGSATLLPGQVDHVSPTVGDIHRVQNLHPDRVSVSIHVYGGDIGTLRRHVYDVAGGSVSDFVSGYSVVDTTPSPSPDDRREQGLT